MMHYKSFYLVISLDDVDRRAFSTIVHALMSWPIPLQAQGLIGRSVVARSPRRYICPSSVWSHLALHRTARSI
jgi:hypothetical protein